MTHAPEPVGPHLVLRFREHNEYGRQEIHALAFVLERTTLKVADQWGDWHPLLRFDYNSRYWQRVGERVIETLTPQRVTELQLARSDDGPLTVAFHEALKSFEGVCISEQEHAGTILFERPASDRSALVVKLRERNAFDGAGRHLKTKLAYQDSDGFHWRRLGDFTTSIVGTLLIRTPGRGLTPELPRIQPGRALRPSGLTLGVSRAA